MKKRKNKFFKSLMKQKNLMYVFENDKVNLCFVERNY